MNGIETAHLLKTHNPQIKIIFLTAYDRFEYAQEAIKLGVEEFIVKPAANEQTIEMLQSIILKLEYEKRIKLQEENLELKLRQISGYLEGEFVSSLVNGEIDEKQAD